MGIPGFRRLVFPLDSPTALHVKCLRVLQLLASLQSRKGPEVDLQRCCLGKTVRYCFPGGGFQGHISISLAEAFYVK